MEVKLYRESRLIKVQRELCYRAGCYRSQCSLSDLQPCWLRKTEASHQGVDVHGYFLSEIGLGESVRSLYSALALQGMPVSACNRQLSGRANAFPFEATETKPTYSTSLSVGGYKSIKKIAKEICRNKTNIAYPFWELEDWPPAMIKALKNFDAVWAPSNFILEGLRASGIGHAVLVKQPIAIHPRPSFSKSSRDGLQILFFYDFNSGIERKNSKACIKAFQKAFPTGDDVHLTIKVMGERDFGARQWLNTVAATDRRITVIDNIISRSEIEQLMSDHDVFMSLHRSEGVGLGCAEALSMGKIVIATDYSGTTDFINPSTGFPVQWKKQYLKSNDYAYVSDASFWADPDIDDAAEKLSSIYQNPKAAFKKASAGHELVAKNHSFDAIGRRMKSELQLLQKNDNTEGS